MTRGSLPSVRRASIRVALTATIVVAAVYVAVALGVVVLVERGLTDQVDQRLRASFERLPREGPPDGGPIEPPAPERLGGAPVILWAIDAEGRVETAPTNPSLPAVYAAVREPVTARVNGVELRLAGSQVGDDWIVMGQSLEPVSETRAKVVLAEIAIAPVLFLAVFLGAVAIGRRAAAPIEASRQRQLDFTADASHELRTPLAVIEAHASLALAHDRDVDWYRASFERVDRESKRMRRMLEDMLWLARVDLETRTPDVEPVDLGIVAARAVDRFGPIAERRRLTLAFHGPADHSVVAAPVDWLDRLLGVLLDNACKYAPEGGRIDVTVSGDSSRVSLAVDDSGTGIPKAERARIFDRFHRATDAGDGAGLGLAIADAIVRGTGGRWQVASAPSGGARMAVSWSRVRA